MDWYAICVPSRKEEAAQSILTEGGFNIFCPVGHRVRRARRGQGKAVIAVPRMPGYLFIGFEHRQVPPWFEVARYQIVRGVLGHDGEPLAIPEPIMRKVFMMQQRPIPYVNKPHGRRSYRLKGTLDIVNGPYQGRTVKVIEADGLVKDMFELFKGLRQAA